MKMTTGDVLVNVHQIQTTAQQIFEVTQALKEAKPTDTSKAEDHLEVIIRDAGIIARNARKLLANTTGGIPENLEAIITATVGAA